MVARRNLLMGQRTMVSGFDMIQSKTGRAFRLLQACCGRPVNITGTEISL